MNKFRDIIGRANYALTLVVIALLPFPQICLRYACGLWFITWALEFRWLQKPNHQLPITNHQSPITNHQSPIPFLLFGAWFVWQLISGLWAADSAAWGAKMERYLTFAMLVPVSLWGVNEHYDRRQMGRTWVISCLVAFPLYLAWMTFVYLHPEIVPYLNVPDSWEQHAGWFTFFNQNISAFKHRLFLDSVLLFGAVIALEVYKDKKYKLAFIVPVLLLFIAMTDSRQALITTFVLAVILIRQVLPKRFAWSYWTGIVVLFGALLFGLVKVHPRARDFGLNGLTNVRELSYYHDVRLNIWGAAVQHPDDYLAFGLGAGQSTAYLAQQFEEAGIPTYVPEHYNTHNQYLEELLENGIGGLILFLLAWLSIPLCADPKNRRLAVLFTVLFMLNMCTECMFGKFCGVALWAAGMLLILTPLYCTPTPLGVDGTDNPECRTDTAGKAQNL